MDNLIPSEELKDLAATAVAFRVKDGDFIGIGSGTTVLRVIEKIGDRIRNEGLQVKAIVSSYSAQISCRAAGIEVLTDPGESPDWGFDGADEIDCNLNMLKGSGGAIVRERIIGSSVSHLVTVVDESKIVKRLGMSVPVVVEVVPYALALVQASLSTLGAYQVTIKTLEGRPEPFVSELGNLLLLARFKRIEMKLHTVIKSLPGVIETGIFADLSREIVVGKQDGVWSVVKNGLELEWRVIPKDQNPI